MEKGYVRSTIILEKKHKDLIYTIKKHRSYIDYYSLHTSGRYVIFDFKKNTHRVLEAILSLDGLVVDDFKYDGKEFWKVLIYRDKINELLDILKSEGDIQVLGMKEYEHKEDELTPQELKILSLAFMQGYFNFPKSIRMGKLAKFLGVNKATVAYHLRSAERKMINRYLEELRFRNIIQAKKDYET
ncbi:Bacterioopsin transcriptional activator [Metallosphaera sp. J1]|uniref:helix-turn-helix domain-containing protein n=1 Tax=Metallosphaera javensis (ex Sakai et al. 2022) TaxID=2775498 RepID=UPI002582FA2A|nr:Bacterioopsin transcriptional activator [Metallosphaera javensis (ex Hofmann et al. 2022)]